MSHGEVHAPGGLIVEQLVPVRVREGFEELSGVVAGRPVSVGVTNEGLFPDALPAAEFETYLRSMTSLEIDGAARTLGVEANGHHRWAVLWERFTGPTLDGYVAQHGPLATDDAISVVLALAHTLERAHARGLVHGDVSPAWVTVMSTPARVEVRLAGFGLGQLVARSKKRVPRVLDDVSGLGALMHLMLTGTLPRGVPSPLPASSSHLTGFLNRALGLELSMRFRSMTDLIDALTDANRTRVSPGTVIPGGKKRSGIGLRTLGPWELVELLGEGAMGQVFLARHSLLGRQAAIKVLRPEQYQREDLIQRFFQEARSVNQINHEHIVEISDFGQELGSNGKPDAVYFVMELLQGQTLTARIAKGPLPVERSVHIIKQVASALEAAHRLGVVHRDVKTDNVFLIRRNGDDDYVKVLDFGVAKLTQVTADAPTISTMDGAIIGTPTSMSPEQASGQVVDRRADVYAVGVQLYLLLSGKLPIDADNFGKLMAQLLTRQPESLPAKTPGGEPIPPKLSALVMRCLAKAPADRPQTMEALITLLDDAMVPDSASRPSLPQVVEPPLPKRRTGAVVGGLGAVVAIAVGVVVAMSGADRPPASIIDAGQPVLAVVVPVPPPVVEEIDAGPVVEDVVVDAGVSDEVDAGTTATVKRPPSKPVPFSQKLMDSAFARRQSRFDACLFKHQALIPEGKNHVKIHFVADKSGQLSDVSVIDGDVAAPLAKCLVDAFKSIELPKLTAKVGGGFRVEVKKK